jgi:hypothetical protein
VSFRLSGAVLWVLIAGSFFSGRADALPFDFYSRHRLMRGAAGMIVRDRHWVELNEAVTLSQRPSKYSTGRSPVQSLHGGRFRPWGGIYEVGGAD